MVIMLVISLGFCFCFLVKYNPQYYWVQYSLDGQFENKFLEELIWKESKAKPANLCLL